MNYVTTVQLAKYIRTLVLSLALTGLGTTASQAANLTPDERQVCSTLRICVDIIRRHDASEFDYAVLETEFQRFGPVGRRALIDVLHSKAGNADIAKMIFKSAPLSSSERANLKNKWSLDRAEIYLPFLLDGHPLSRDFLLLSLGSDNPAVRERVRRALLDLPKTVERQPVPQTLLRPLLSALTQDPIAEAAPYLSRLNAEGSVDEFASLLGSGEVDLVFAAYEALYRKDRSTAFGSLLAEMDRVKTSDQSQAIGDMLLRRHANRPDGFYLKFANDMSGDQARSVPARASGLHAVLISNPDVMPEFTFARAEALRFLVKGQPFVVQDKYLSVLKRMKAEQELNLIWKIASEEKWINRDRIAEAFNGLKSQDRIIGELIRADDFRTFAAGVTQAKPLHTALLRGKINHPIKAIQDLARKTIRLPPNPRNAAPCIISKFDAKDWLNQMPFFDSAWLKADNNSRVVLDRKYLTSAHPSQTGWLAGYHLQKRGAASAQTGAALLHFDNKTGEFGRVGDFSGPIAILPDRLLKLGQSTNRFWVIDQWRGGSTDISAYSVDLSSGFPTIKHLGAIPNSARDFSVAPNGDLLMNFKGGTQAPIRMSPRGDISLACRSLQPVTAAPAPN